MLHGRGLRSGLEQLAQTALGPSRLVPVDHIFAGGAIESLRRNPEFRLSLFQVASLDRFADTADLAPHVALDRPVVQASFLVLTESFLGAGGIRHEWATLEASIEMGGRVLDPKFESRSMPAVLGDVQS